MVFLSIILASLVARTVSFLSMVLCNMLLLGLDIVYGHAVLDFVRREIFQAVSVVSQNTLGLNAGHGSATDDGVCGAQIGQIHARRDGENRAGDLEEARRGEIAVALINDEPIPLPATPPAIPIPNNNANNPANNIDNPQGLGLLVVALEGVAAGIGGNAVGVAGQMGQINQVFQAIDDPVLEIAAPQPTPASPTSSNSEGEGSPAPSPPRP